MLYLIMACVLDTTSEAECVVTCESDYSECHGEVWAADAPQPLRDECFCLQIVCEQTCGVPRVLPDGCEDL
jgi:hypothetical protein